MVYLLTLSFCQIMMPEMIKCLMNNELEKKYSWLNSRLYSGVLLEELRETTNNFSECNLSPDRDLTQRILIYEAGVLNPRSQRSCMIPSCPILHPIPRPACKGVCFNPLSTVVTLCRYHVI
jgi:hypothetical protein